RIVKLPLLASFVCNSPLCSSKERLVPDNGRIEKDNKRATTDQSDSPASVPTLSLPKGGGAIRGIDEKFSANPVTGTGSLSIPIFTTAGRSDFSPKVSLSYDSGAGAGPFGIGWSLSIPSIPRTT